MSKEITRAEFYLSALNEDIENVRVNVIRELTAIMYTAERAAKDLRKEDWHLNSLGVFQNHGGRIDMEIAKLMAMRDIAKDFTSNAYYSTQKK